MTKLYFTILFAGTALLSKGQKPFYAKEIAKWDTVTIIGLDTINSNYQNSNIINGQFTEYQKVNYFETERLFPIVSGKLENKKKLVIGSSTMFQNLRTILFVLCFGVR